MALTAAALATLGVSACGGEKGEPAAPAASITTAAGAPVSDSGASAAVLTGTRYYLEMNDREAVIHAVRGDVDQVTTRVPLGEGGCVRNTITISPYGERLAWVEGRVNQDSGTLWTSMIDGSQKTKIERKPPFRSEVACLGSNPLVWNTDDKLMVEDGPVLIDVADGEPVEGDAGSEVLKWWSADGRSWAALSDGKPYAAGEDGWRFYRYTPPKDEAARYDGWRVRSVSMDGRYVAVGWMNTDPSRNDGSFAVVDTTTSKVVDLSGEGEIRSIMFTADNKVLVRRATGISVLDSSFKPLGTVTEPAAFRELTLLAYAA